jgi:hypothetical protein
MLWPEKWFRACVACQCNICDTWWPEVSGVISILTTGPPIPLSTQPCVGFYRREQAGKGPSDKASQECRVAPQHRKQAVLFMQAEPCVNFSPLPWLAVPPEMVMPSPCNCSAPWNHGAVATPM